MTFRQFIFFILIATASLWLGFWWIIVSVDPYQTNWLGFVLFYGTLFLALTGTFTLASLFIRKIRMPNELLFHLVLLSFRQSIVLAVFFSVLLFLQGERLLTWWNVLGLFALVFIIEMVILNKEKKHYQVTVDEVEEPVEIVETVIIEEKTIEEPSEPQSLDELLEIIGESEQEDA